MWERRGQLSRESEVFVVVRVYCFAREFNVANQASTTCRLRLELSVETSTPPFFGRAHLTPRGPFGKGRFSSRPHPYIWMPFSAPGVSPPEPVASVRKITSAPANAATTTCCEGSTTGVSCSNAASPGGLYCSVSAVAPAPASPNANYFFRPRRPAAPPSMREALFGLSRPCAARLRPIAVRNNFLARERHRS